MYAYNRLSSKFDGRDMLVDVPQECCGTPAEQAQRRKEIAEGSQNREKIADWAQNRKKYTDVARKHKKSPVFFFFRDQDQRGGEGFFFTPSTFYHPAWS